MNDELLLLLWYAELPQVLYGISAGTMPVVRYRGFMIIPTRGVHTRESYAGQPA